MSNVRCYDHAQQSLNNTLSRFGRLAAVSLGSDTPFGLRGTSGFEAHGMVVEADSMHSSVGLVLSGLLVTMLVGSVRRTGTNSCTWHTNTF